jgi:beta-glucanase (GH16 family)
LTKYVLEWQDVFDYEGLPNPNKWSYDVGARRWGNGETQYYTKGANVTVSPGLMTLVGKIEPYLDSPYTSCRMTTYEKKHFQYGRIEVRAKVPANTGSWPAIWMLPVDFKEQKTSWPKCGEIDIMEHVTHLMDTHHVSLHTELYNHGIKTQRTYLEKRPGFTKEFHTFGMDWTKDYIEFFLDGVAYKRFYRNEPGFDTSERGWPFDKPYYLIINIAIGGTWGGHVNESEYPCYFPIEFVKYYSIIES